MRARVWTAGVAVAFALSCDDGASPGAAQQGQDAAAGADAQGGAGGGPLDQAVDEGPMDAAPSPEAGAALDLGDVDDAGALIDRGAPVDGGGPSEVAPCVFTVRVGDVEVFAYEASRADAAEGDPGQASDGVCSQAGVLPWAQVTQQEAQQACESVGFHLCTDQEWAQVCQGPRGWTFPYGQAHRGGVCNDHVTGSAAVEPTGSRAGCVTPEGVFDLSGNLWEMSAGESRWGASYLLNASFRETYYAGCGGEVFHIAGTPFPDVGFRCCR